jgi:hypothetical protein
MTLRKIGGTGIWKGSTRSYWLENSLRKRLRTCRKTDCTMNERMNEPYCIFQLDSLRNKTAERKGDKALFHIYGFGKGLCLSSTQCLLFRKTQDLSENWVWRKFLIRNKSWGCFLFFLFSHVSWIHDALTDANGETRSCWLCEPC